MNFFILAFEWLGLVITLFIFSVTQIIRLIKERNELTKIRIQKAVIFTVLFLLTFFKSFTNGIIEKADWFVLEAKREKIVNQVLNKELNPNVSWNGWVCELPYEFPVVSNGGNDIGISRNDENGKTTVSFWVFRNFFDSPSTKFVYTNDPEQIKELEKRVIERPEDNWKLKEYWYRTYGEW
jgi:hypothetical protein